MKKEKMQYIGLSVITAFCFLAICSRSSFIYVFNNWDDANSYFSMGKVMMNGGVIYRDIFDQKGPLLYFIYGIAYLLSHNTFRGVFILEILSLAFFLAAQYKTARLYLNHNTSMVLLPAAAMVVTVSKSFYWGGSAEEFGLPFLAWGLYLSVKYFKEEYPGIMSRKIVFACGFLAGCIMLIKYTMLGFYFFWMAMVALSTFHKKHWKDSILNCVVFLAGMASPLIPWLIYFGANGALDDWYHAYIYCNVFLYSDFYQETVGTGQKIYDLAKILYWLIIDNFIYFSMIILGFVGFLLNRRIRWYEKINIYGLFGFLFLGIYIGGTTLFYYSLPLSLFSVFGLIVLGMGLEKVFERFSAVKEKKKTDIAGSVIIYAGLLAAAWNLSMNTEYSKQKAEDFFLYEFRDFVLQEEEPTLLNISCLDIGLYTVADIMPNCKYFQTNAVHGFEEVREEQLRYMQEGKIEFVIASETYPEEILKNYELQKEAEFAMYGGTRTYYLFQKK